MKQEYLDKNGFPEREGVYLVRGIWSLDEEEEIERDLAGDKRKELTVKQRRIDDINEFRTLKKRLMKEL